MASSGVDARSLHSWLADYYGYWLVGPELFDERQFSISGGEASNMDPQQRHILEQSYAALYSSGASKQAVQGSSTGVVVAMWNTEFRFMNAVDSVYNQQNISISVASGRVAFALGLHGPCISIDTACSSSLAASHSAVRALQHTECRDHVVTGVNLVLSGPAKAVPGMTSEVGRCHSFDYRADGYARAEACSACVLHAADDSLSLSPQLRGTAVQQDGRSASLTAPNLSLIHI